MAFEIREVDPDGPDVEAFADVVRRSNAEEFGDLAQQRGSAELRARLLANPHRLRCFVGWLDDLPVVSLDMQTLPEEELDMVEVHIRVLKDYHGYTFGYHMLQHAERIALAMGRPRITGMSASRRPHDRNGTFLRRAGFTVVNRVLRQDLRLPADATRLAVDVPPGIVVETHHHIDENMLLAFAHLLKQRDETLTEFCMPISPDEVRSMYAKGLGLLISLARHTASEELVGYCELLTHPATPIADQGPTYVTTEFKGLGLTKALKAACITELNTRGGPRALRQFVEEEESETADLNRELGFTDTASYQRWQKIL